MQFPWACIEKMLYNCSLVSSHGFIYLSPTAKELNLFHPSSYKSFFIPLVITGLPHTLSRLGPPKFFPILEDNSMNYTQNSNPNTYSPARAL